VTKRVTVSLDDDLHDWVAEQAQREERTVPNYLAWLAKKAYLEWEESQQQKQNPQSNQTEGKQ
jgi:predicted transcriptional regulator